MLSKRASDIIMVVIIAVIAVVVVVVRFQVLGAFDGRIEEAEERNASLEDEIAGYTRTLETYYRDEVLPGWSTLSRNVPAVYTEESLLAYVYGILEMEGINRREEGQALHVRIYEDVSFPSGSPFRSPAQDLEAYRIFIDFHSPDIEKAQRVVESFHGLDHLFVLMDVEFSIPEEGENTRIRLNFATFYQNP